MAMERLFCGEIASEQARKITMLAGMLEELVATMKVKEADLVMEQIARSMGNIRFLFQECKELSLKFEERGIPWPSFPTSQTAESIPSLAKEIGAVVVFNAADVEPKTNGGVQLIDDGLFGSEKYEEKRKERKSSRLAILTSQQNKVAHILFSLNEGDIEFKTNRQIAEEIVIGELGQSADRTVVQKEVARRLQDVSRNREALTEKLLMLSAESYRRGTYPKLDSLVDWIQSQPGFENVSYRVLAGVVCGEVKTILELRKFENNGKNHLEESGTEIKNHYALTSAELKYLVGKSIFLIEKRHLLHNPDPFKALLRRLNDLYPGNYHPSDVETLRGKIEQLMGDDGKLVLRANPDREIRRLLNFVKNYLKSNNNFPDPSDAIEEFLGVLKKR